jgi:hypothetical protein
MALQLSFEEPNTFVVRVTGEVLHVEAEQVKQFAFDRIEQIGPVFILVQVESAFSNLQAFVDWRDDERDAFIQKNVIRMAIVGDARWHDFFMVLLLSGAVPFQIECFPPHQADFARAWLSA